MILMLIQVLILNIIKVKLLENRIKIFLIYKELNNKNNKHNIKVHFSLQLARNPEIEILILI
jgi:hypothetical protein